MRNWWHRLWCRDCRNVRPTSIMTLPNDDPLYAPTSYILVHSAQCRLFDCPTARAWAEWYERAALRALSLLPQLTFPK